MGPLFYLIEEVKMQPGKLSGANPTHLKEMRKMVKTGYNPQQISDALKVNLLTVLSFFQQFSGKTDEEMKKYSKVDVSSNVMAEAEAAAKAIIDSAENKAATMVEEAKKAKDELEKLKAEIAEAEEKKLAALESSDKGKKSK